MFVGVLTIERRGRRREEGEKRYEATNRSLSFHHVHRLLFYHHLKQKLGVGDLFVGSNDGDNAFASSILILVPVSCWTCFILFPPLPRMAPALILGMLTCETSHFMPYS